MKFLLIDTREKPKAIHNILAEEFNADRKTENCSEKPNNSTGYNLSPVEDEPQTERSE